MSPALAMLVSTKGTFDEATLACNLGTYIDEWFLGSAFDYVDPTDSARDAASATKRPAC